MHLVSPTSPPIDHHAAYAQAFSTLLTLMHTSDKESTRLTAARTLLHVSARVLKLESRESEPLAAAPPQPRRPRLPADVSPHPPAVHSRMAATAARSNYTLPGTTRNCAATGREIATGETYVAALVQTGEPGNEDFRRLDFCSAAWGAGARPTDAAGRRLPLLGSWKSVMTAPGASRRILIDDEALLDLFEQSGEASPEATADSVADPRVFRFMLALILIRKRLLVCEKTDRGGVMYVRPRGSPKSTEGGTLSPVEDPGLNEDSVARVVTQLAAVLDGAESASGKSPDEARRQGGVA